MYKLLFVTSVFNRVAHLKITLPKNIEAIRNFENTGLLVVDFGGEDSSEITDFIDGQFSFDIMAGSLIYYKAIKPWSKFHMSTAKNIAHRLVESEYYFSLDADNFISVEDISNISNVFKDDPDTLLHQTTGAAPMHYMMWEKYNLFPDKSIYHNTIPTWDGSSGRIGVSRKCFNAVNGYNEFLTGMGMEDNDFLMRNIFRGYHYKHMEITRSHEAVYIQHGTEDPNHAHVENDENWAKMDIGIKKNILVPQYTPHDTVDNFQRYMPKCIEASRSKKVTLFSSIFNAESYEKRFLNDVVAILKGADNLAIWLLDIKSSNSAKFSERLLEFSKTDSRLYYIPVYKDPGLYETWNTCLKNIGSPYVGNLNVDDIRGEGWLAPCLAALNSNLCDVASPRVYKLEDQFAATYDQAKKCIKPEQKQWFKTKIVLNGDKPSHKPLVDGKYYHEDMFQVVQGGKLLSYTIPNSTPIWKKEIHDSVVYFNEEKNGCFADLALWLEASAKGYRFQQIDYDVFFCVHENQAYRRQQNDVKRLFSLVLKYGSPDYQLFARKRLFDLSRVQNGNYVSKEWKRVKDNICDHFVHTEGNLLLDLFVEQTFGGNSEKNIQDKFQYQSDWMGFVHTAPHWGWFYTSKTKIIDKLFSERCFLESLQYCKGIVVLNINSKAQVEQRLAALSMNVPVFLLLKPSIPFNKDMVRFFFKKRDRLLSIECFIQELEQIAVGIYLTYYG